MKFYLLIVRGDVEPELKGPFPTENMRDTYAWNYRDMRDPDAFDGLFPLDVDVQGKPQISAYSGKFFD